MTTRFGYTLMTEQSGPKELVRYAQTAEDQGFDFEVSSDHYSPWLAAQGHAPYAWSVLGAVAHVTSRVELMTYVTCPIQRYHPAVVAQKAATLQILADGRFTLGLGSGENLNEHITGEGWVPIDQRQDMLAEAIEIIRELHTGELTTYDGEYFRVDSARIWDVPGGGVPIAVAAGGTKAVQRFGPLADHLINTEPLPELITQWERTGGGFADRQRCPCDRSDPDLVAPEQCGQSTGVRPRAVSLVRRRMGGQRRPADDSGIRRRVEIRAPGGCRGDDRLRT